MQTESMKPGGAAERDGAIRSAHEATTDREVGRSDGGAANRSSDESPCIGQGEGLIEQMIARDNLNTAWKKVRSNRGAAGVDGLGIEASRELIRTQWKGIEARMLAGTYQSKPVKRVEIPKPGGGVRKLGVPTVFDRFIQQAALQVLAPLFEPGFSEHSYGFRPGRSAHQAVKAALEHQRGRRQWVVDIDLASFFDEVNHDLLMARVRRKVKDVRMLKLIRAFLDSGVMWGGLCRPTEKGTPQGGPLSPLLSNILLDDLDKELERRGHRFCRYADDCNIYVGSQRGGERVMASLVRFLEERMKLKVNREKSAVERSYKRVFLGYSFTVFSPPKLRVPEKSCQKMRAKLRERFRRGRGCRIEDIIEQELNPLLRGWIAYFQLSETKSFAGELDRWIRRRLRCVLWRQWKTPHTRYKRLRQLGLEEDRARRVVWNGRGPWRNSGSREMSVSLPPSRFATRGLISLLDRLKRPATAAS